MSQHWLDKGDRLCALRHVNKDICTGIATEVDHINGWRTQREFWDMRNWQGLCKQCHGRKTAQELRGPVRHDAKGMPTDPNHPWNVEDEDSD